MSMRVSALVALFSAFTVLSFSPATPAEARPAAKPSVCGAPFTGAFTEPPRVEMWTLRPDAGGRPELVLGVHKDRDRYCYRYTLNGVAHTVAPVIVVRRGERFDLRIANDISSQSRGEFVASNVLPACMPMPMPHAKVVHYTGYLNHQIDDLYMPKLATDTNVHLHGFQGPAIQENIFLSTLSTPMHACEYHLDIPKTQPPGTYFYHPHVHGGSDEQIAGGLAGVWIVEPDTPQIAASADHLAYLAYRWPAALDYQYMPDYTAFYFAGMNREAALKNSPPVSYDPFNPPAWPLGFPFQAAGLAIDPHACEGIGGSEPLITVDGYAVPATLTVPGGQEQLLRIVNGTSDSPKTLKLRDENGNTVPMHVAEVDGNPLSGDMAHPLARYLTVDKLMVSSANRSDVLVNVPPGRTYTLWSTHYCAGPLGFLQLPHPLLHVTGNAVTETDPAPAVESKPVDVADTPAGKLVAFARAHPSLVRKRAITFTEYLFPSHGKKIPIHSSFFITDTTNPNFREHGFYPLFAAGQAVPEQADITVKRGSIEEWYLFNTTMESHTFHIHQMSFVEMSGGPNGVPVTIDDMFDPVGTLVSNPKDPQFPLVKPSLVRVLMDFRNVPRGTFVFHCHMLFHEDRGMMGIIRVV
ncbi:MAG TPA: multicopper oxidase domain-containing protein [Candidatus Baltobacteraceae bacterium]|nr:multicopper oxidase domain-containing protein [Candidatus Baltobacteraceae bacterium]